MKRPKLVPRGEQRARALIKPRSEPGRGGRTLHAMEDRTLRLAEKAFSCGQEMGHRG